MSGPRTFCLICSILILLKRTSAQVYDYCKLRGDELSCQNLYNCSDLRFYRGYPAKYLALVNCCQSTPLEADDLYKFQNVSRLELISTEMENYALKNLQHLTVLEINYSSLRHLHPEMFSSNKKLVHLDLRNSNIHYLPTTVFASLEHLRVIRLAGNAIVAFEPGVFWHNKRLKSVDLSFNGITEVNDHLFSEDSQISRLNLSNNDITEFRNFGNYSQLTDLDLSHNNITAPETFIFDQLNYRSERIEKLGEKVAPIIVRLYDNPFRCVCGPLAEAYKQNNALGLKLNVICGDRQPWDILQSLECSHEVTTEVKEGNKSSTTATVSTISTSAATDFVPTNTLPTFPPISATVSESPVTVSLPSSTVSANVDPQNTSYATPPTAVTSPDSGGKTQNILETWAVVLVGVLLVFCLVVALCIISYIKGWFRFGRVKEPARNDNEMQKILSDYTPSTGSFCAVEVRNKTEDKRLQMAA